MGEFEVLSEEEIERGGVFSGMRVVIDEETGVGRAVGPVEEQEKVPVEGKGEPEKEVKVKQGAEALPVSLAPKEGGMQSGGGGFKKEENFKPNIARAEVPQVQMQTRSALPTPPPTVPRTSYPGAFPSVSI